MNLLNGSQNAAAKALEKEKLVFWDSEVTAQQSEGSKYPFLKLRTLFSNPGQP